MWLAEITAVKKPWNISGSVALKYGHPVLLAKAYVCSLLSTALKAVAIEVQQLDCAL